MHDENLNDPPAGEETPHEPAMKGPLLLEGGHVRGKEAEDSVPQEDSIVDLGAEEKEAELIKRRKYPRSEFTYPVEFKLFVQNPEHASFKGYLKDISASGARLQFEDRYGRFKTEEMNNAKIKISFSIPNGDKPSIFARIRWIKKVDPRNFIIKMGIEFQNLEEWQLDVIEKLIHMRNKDHNMMWNLWEQYENNWR